VDNIEKIKQMNIRLANKFDLPYFTKLVHEIHKRGEIGDFPVKINDEYINAMFVSTIHGAGISLIAESDSTVGMLTAIISPNIWSETTLVMNQILLYVDEEYRHTRAGYMLLKKYEELCEELKSKGRIHYYTLNSAKSMFDLDFTRFGYTKIAETWASLGE